MSGMPSKESRPLESPSNVAGQGRWMCVAACRRAGCGVLMLLAGTVFAATGCASTPTPLYGPAVAATLPPEATRGVVQTSALEPIAAPSAVYPATDAAPPYDEEPSKFDWSDLSPSKMVEDIKQATGLGPDETVARTQLAEGKALLDHKSYGEAADRFKTAAKRWPDSAIEEDALFLLAECYFFTDQYAKAQDAYDNLLKKYDNSRYLDTSCKRLFSIGHYWEQLNQKDPSWPVTPNLTDKERPLFDTFGNAIKAYDTIRMKDPRGPLADDSIMATGNAYFTKGHYEDAAYYYDLLRKEYPDSEHQFQAHILGLQSKLRVYQGELYDGVPLDEADEIAAQTLSQFREELGGEQTRLAQARDAILDQKARRDLAIAQYYDNKKEYGAARIYYQYIIEDYPLTPTAQQARARLDQIRDEPDRPANRFKWLTDRFPEDR